MSGQEVRYTLGFEVRRRGVLNNQVACPPHEPAEGAIPRIARLIALAIRLEA